MTSVVEFFCRFGVCATKIQRKKRRANAKTEIEHSAKIKGGGGAHLFFIFYFFHLFDILSPDVVDSDEFEVQNFSGIIELV